MNESYKIRTGRNNLYMQVTKGHFATSHSHMNYYIDVTKSKADIGEAKSIAEALREYYKSNTLVDTILCLDGMEVIATCLAEALTRPEYTSINAGRPISVLTAEHTTGSQIIFRDNNVQMINGKHVLIIAVSIVSGFTALGAITAVKYYGGNPVGVCSIFATEKECHGIPITSLFNPSDFVDYRNYPVFDCPMCRNKIKIDAVINNFGCSSLE